LAKLMNRMKQDVPDWLVEYAHKLQPRWANYINFIKEFDHAFSITHAEWFSGHSFCSAAIFFMLIFVVPILNSCTKQNAKSNHLAFDQVIGSRILILIISWTSL
jgi:hypothetical protein